jgi:hypothetical protein
MTQSTPANTIDAHVQDLEDALVYLFDLPVNTDLDGFAFDINQHGHITDIFKSVANSAPGSNSGPGWRLMDTTAGNETDMLVMVEDGKLRFYDNTGTTESPVWTERNSLDASTGELSAGGRMPSGCGAYGVYGSTDFRSANDVSFNNLAWAEAGWTPGISWSSGARTKFTAAIDGYFQFSFTLAVLGQGAGLDYTDIQLGAYLSLNNGTIAQDAVFQGGQASWTGIDGWCGVTGTAVVAMTLGDFVELNLTVSHAAGDDYTGHLSRARMDAIMVGF